MNILTSGAITEKQAAEQLSLSVRQIQRMRKKFILEGKTIGSLLFHRVHPQVNKVPDSIYQKVVLLKQGGSHRYLPGDLRWKILGSWCRWILLVYIIDMGHRREIYRAGAR